MRQLTEALTKPNCHHYHHHHHQYDYRYIARLVGLQKGVALSIDGRKRMLCGMGVLSFSASLARIGSLGAGQVLASQLKHNCLHANLLSKSSIPR